MRTTVDLPPALHRRVRALAASRRTSVSATIAELTRQAIDQLEPDDEVVIDDESGLPAFAAERAISNDEVLAFLDEDE